MWRKFSLNSFALTALAVMITGLSAAAEPLVLRLYPGVSTEVTAEQITKGGGVANVTVPEIAVHLPEESQRSGMALIVCPGGSYREVGAFADGMRTVPYFVPKGIAVIVLKYRTRPPSENVVAEALEDAKRAVRLVRANAREWGISPQRIGMIGSSAGSHLILNLASHADSGLTDAADPVERLSSRPDFIILLCPWPNRRGVEQFPITAQTPPAWIATATDDAVAPIGFSEALVEAYRKAGVPIELRPVEKGGHTAFKQVRNPAYHWMDWAMEWITRSEF